MEDKFFVRVSADRNTGIIDAPQLIEEEAGTSGNRHDISKYAVLKQETVCVPVRTQVIAYKSLAVVYPIGGRIQRVSHRGIQSNEPILCLSAGRPNRGQAEQHEQEEEVRTD